MDELFKPKKSQTVYDKAIVNPNQPKHKPKIPWPTSSEGDISPKDADSDQEQPPAASSEVNGD